MPPRNGTDRQEKLRISGFPRLFALAFGAWEDTLPSEDRRNADARMAQKIGVDPKTPANWRNAVSAPPKKTWEQAARLLGQAPANAGRMEELGAAWARARGQVIVAPVPRAISPVAETHRFEALGRTTVDEQLLDFAISATQGSTPGHIELAPTLDFGSSPYVLDGVRFTIAVRCAKVIYDAPGCEPKPGTKYEKAPECVVDGAAWVFTAVEGSALRGPQLRGETLVVLSAQSGRADIRFRVQCDDESGLLVQARSETAPLTTSLERVAAQYLKKKTCDRQPDGTFHIAKAALRMRRVKL